MTKPSRTFLLIEERLGTDLIAYVAEHRGREKATSWHGITVELFQATRVSVHPETLRLWFADQPAAGAEAS